uniref:EGF-like domain-containing protein n=1 Tax=Romanomermis culicivorax TaxID=13658 RepID=A0A915HP86_ROMCU
MIFGGRSFYKQRNQESQKMVGKDDHQGICIMKKKFIEWDRIAFCIAGGTGSMRLLSAIFHLFYAGLLVNGALPKPAWDCVDDKIIAKYYNETCGSDEDCFGRSMKCTEGHCVCNENYVPAERFVGENAKQLVCVAAPSLFEECSTICQTPYVCKEHGELKKRICHCEPPFKLEDRSCHLECKENEDYDSRRFLCIPMGQIGDACLAEKQCLPAFSQCNGGKCSCLEGFIAKDGLCVPDEIRCPNDKVIKEPKICVFKKSPEDKRYNYRLIDDCPPDHYCHTYQILQYELLSSSLNAFGGSYKNEGSEGYCCPKAQSVCPVGKPHPTAKCRGSTSFVDNVDTQCPWDSYYCASTHGDGDELCCPKRCETSMIFIKGKCLPSARLGDPCTEDAQCTDSRTKCENGVCKCRSGSKETRQPTYAYCSVECPEDELLHDDKCYAPLSLGDSCTNQTWRCPANAFCNKFNVCSCSCPRFTLTKDVCAPMPACPAPRRHVPYFRSAMGVAAMMESDQAKYYQPISDDKRRELLQNITFCAVTGRNPPKIEHVEQCPEGKYCAHYLKDLGICCKIPEYTCPNGKKPISVKQCSTKKPLDCGLKNYCHDYLYTADPDSPDGKMCCETENQ